MTLITLTITSLPGGPRPPNPPREAPPVHPQARVVGGFDICAKNSADRTLQKLGNLEAVPGSVQFK
eukprot:7711793-Alexandrium_andersonii.AAC.1